MKKENGKGGYLVLELGVGRRVAGGGSGLQGSPERRREGVYVREGYSRDVLFFFSVYNSLLASLCPCFNTHTRTRTHVLFLFLLWCLMVAPSFHLYVPSHSFSPRELPLVNHIEKSQGPSYFKIALQAWIIAPDHIRRANWNPSHLLPFSPTA